MGEVALARFDSWLGSKRGQSEGAVACLLSLPEGDPGPQHSYIFLTLKTTHMYTTVLAGGHVFHHKTPLDLDEKNVTITGTRWREQRFKTVTFPKELLIFTGEIVVEQEAPATALPATWSDTETNPGEIFAFGRFKGLRMDGSTGLGDAADRADFDNYIIWYNKTKHDSPTGPNKAYLKAKQEGTVVAPLPPQGDLPF